MTKDSQGAGEGSLDAQGNSCRQKNDKEKGASGSSVCFLSSTERMSVDDEELDTRKRPRRIAKGIVLLDVHWAASPASASTAVSVRDEL